MALRTTQVNLGQLTFVATNSFRCSQIVLCAIVSIRGGLDGSGSKTSRPRRFVYV